MEINLHKNAITPFDSWFNRFLFNSYRSVLKLNDGVFNLFKTLFGIIGLIIAIPLLLVLAIIGWVFLLSLNYRIERDVEDYNTLINTWDNRKKMEAHLIFEKGVKKLDLLMKGATSRRFVINPITKQSIILLNNMKEMEQTLKTVAYPTINEVYSKEDQEYLLSVFEDSDCKDWKDKSSLSYNV